MPTYYDEITNEELVNALFEPWELVNKVQASLLGTAFELTCGALLKLMLALEEETDQAL